MRVLALCFGDASCASSFYRITQYVNPLRELGVTLETIPANSFQDWSTISDYDTVVVQKKLFPLGKLRQLRRFARRVIYDIDDAIWHPHGRSHHWLTRLRTNWRLQGVVRTASYCLTANQVLGAFLRRWNERIVTFPMALNDKVWRAKASSSGQASRVRIGWAGAPVNLPYLESLELPLLAVQQRYPGVEICVFSGRQPAFKQLPYRHLPYQQGTEAENIREFDIGLLPLPADAFSQGKSPIKGLQYLAIGLPIVVSPTGGTNEMFAGCPAAQFARTNEEWIEALENLVRQADLRQQLGQQARKHFEAHFTLAITAPRFADLLRSC